MACRYSRSSPGAPSPPSSPGVRLPVSLPPAVEPKSASAAPDRPENIRRVAFQGDRFLLGLSSRSPAVNTLTLYGLFAVTAMLVTYALEDRSTWFILAFAGSCALGSVYGFLQGAWPFGVVEAIWSVVAARRWYLARHLPTHEAPHLK